MLRFFVQPLPPAYIQEQELFLLLLGRGGFDWLSIQHMTIAERLFFVRELNKVKEEEERLRKEAETAAANAKARGPTSSR